MAQHQLNFLRTWCLVSALFHVLTTCSELDDAIELFAQTLGSSEPEENNPALPVKVPDLTESDAEEILDQLGFDAIANTREPGGVRNKLSQFQKLYGLQESGELCNSTKILLKIPRCGVSDVAALGEDFKWDKSFLTYYVRNFPMNIATSSVRQLLQNAFNQWSAVTNLDFIESENHDADIEIIFGGRVHPHRWESCATELGSGILAHAFFPTTGAIHFNTQFFFGSRNEDDFFNTAMHEIGHALGLDHSVNPASIMYPTLVARYSEIPQIDAEKIQLKYGKRDHRSTTFIPKFCNLDKYDAVLYDNSGKLSFISGKYLYSSMTSDKPPISLGEQWPGAPDRLDTAVTIGSHTYLFRDDQVWAFVADKLELGYPRPIRRTFPGLPRHLDAIVHFGSKYLFGFKNEHFWRYNVAQKMVDHSGEVRDLEFPAKSMRRFTMSSEMR
nr:72 kDa type IV collagenase-like [Aedes albopictus]